MSRLWCLAVGLAVLGSEAGRAAPVPKPDGPQPSVAVLRAAFGKGHLGKEVRTVTRALGTHPTIRLSRVLFDDPAKDDGKEDDAFYLTWKAGGLELAFEHGALKSAFLYNKGADGFERYPGELPDGLTFDDEPAKIDRKLGKPEEREEFEGVRTVAGKPQDELWLQYPSKGVLITLRRTGADPYRIHSIHLDEPTKK